LKKGIVESFSQQKEFGFIIQDDGTKLPFYRSSIQMDGYKMINVGDRVGFEVKETTTGPEARTVIKLSFQKTLNSYLRETVGSVQWPRLLFFNGKPNNGKRELPGTRPHKKNASKVLTPLHAHSIRTNAVGSLSVKMGFPP